MKHIIDDAIHINHMLERIFHQEGYQVSHAYLESCISSYYAVLKENNIAPQISIPDKKVKRMLNENALSRVFSNVV